MVGKKLLKKAFSAASLAVLLSTSFPSPGIAQAQSTSSKLVPVTGVAQDSTSDLTLTLPGNSSSSYVARAWQLSDNATNATCSISNDQQAVEINLGTMQQYDNIDGNVTRVDGVWVGMNRTDNTFWTFKTSSATNIRVNLPADILNKSRTSILYDIAPVYRRDSDGVYYYATKGYRCGAKWETTTASTTTTPTNTSTTAIPSAPAGVSMVEEATALKVSWVPVSNAKSYDVVLFEKDNGNQKELAKFENLNAAAGASAVFPKSSYGIVQGREYYAAVWAKNDAGSSVHKASSWVVLGQASTNTTTTTSTSSSDFKVLNRYQQGEGTRIEFEVPSSWGENYSIRLFFDDKEVAPVAEKDAMKAANGVLERASGIGENLKQVFINVPYGKTYSLKAIAVRPKSGKSWSSTSWSDYDDISGWITDIFVYNQATPTSSTGSSSVPAAPARVTHTSESSGIRVKWDAVSNAKTYKVTLLSKSSSGQVEVESYDNLSANAQREVLFQESLGLAKGTEYYAVVWASNDAGTGPYGSSSWSKYGTTVSSNSTSNETTTTNTITSLSQPSNTVLNASSGEVSWNAVANAEKYVFSLEVANQCSSASNCNWGRVLADSTSGTSVKLTGLTANTQYKFIIKARTVVTKDGKTETIDSPNFEKVFTTGKLTESWTEGLASGVSVSQLDGMYARIENGNLILDYDLTKSPLSAKVSKLDLKIMTTAETYALMTKDIPSNDRPQGRVVIPVGNIQGIPQVATILNSNGGANIWLKMSGYNGSTLVSYRTSDSVRIPEAGSVSVSGGFSTQSTTGSTTPVSIDPVSSLGAVYDKDKFEINTTWGSVTGAAGYTMTVTGKDKDGKSFTASQYVTTPGAKIGFPVAGTTYTIKVVAVHATGSTSSSKETTVTIPEWKPYLTEADLNNVTQTTSTNSTEVTVTASVDGTNESVNIPGYTLSWNAINDQYFTNYRLFVRKKENNPVAWEYAANYDAAKTTTYRIVGLSPASTYEYKVTAQYVTLNSDGGLKTTYKDISTVKEFTTPTTQTQPESSDLPAAYKRALENERRVMTSPSDGIRYLKAHIVYKDANGNSQVMQNVFSYQSANPSLRDAPTFSHEKEFYAKVTPANVPGTVEGVILTTENMGPVEDGSKGALWTLNRSSKVDLGSCIFNVSPYCDGATLSGGRKGIYIPKDQLNNGILVEVLSLPTGNLTTYYENGVQVTDVSYNNKLMGYPLALEFELPNVSSANFPQASLLSVEGGTGNRAMFLGMTTVKNVNLQAQFSTNTTKCEVRENDGAWEEIQCIKDNQLHSIPYTLKATQSGEVKLALRATNTYGTRDSQQVTVKYNTTAPTIKLTGVPTTWQTTEVTGIEAKCGDGDTSCVQTGIVVTNHLTTAQECSDLPTVAPTLPFTAVCSQENNFCKNLKFPALPGPNPTYICAQTRDAFGVATFAPKQELKADLISPEASFELTGLTEAGASYYTKNSTVSLKMNDLLAGASGIASCTIGGDVTGTVACPAEGATTNLTLTSGNTTKRITVTVKNGAGVENVFAKYILQDTELPLFTDASNIVAFDRNSNGTVKVKPAIVTDTSLDRIEMTISSSQSGFALPSNLLASIYPGVTISGNTITIRADENGQLNSDLLTSGLALQNLPAQVNGQYITYTITQKGFDKAGNETATQKQLQFTLQEQTAATNITVTGGTVTLPSTSTSTQIPLSITFSDAPVYYTITKNGVEGAKVLYNGYIYLEAGDYSGLTIKFYNAQNTQIGDAFTNLTTKVALAAMSGSIDVAEVTRTTNPNFSFKLLGVTSDADKVMYKVLRGGTQLFTGERQKNQYSQALGFDNLQLAPNSTNEFFVVLTEAGGKETILKRTVIHDTEAPKPSNVQASLLENTKPKWTFTVTDAANTPISSVQARMTNLTTGEERTTSNLSVTTNGQYEVTYNDMSLRPGHEYVLDIITKDNLGNTLETRTTAPLTRVKSQKDSIDMLQHAVNIDNTLVNTELMQVTLANELGTYTAPQMSRGKQVVFGDVLAAGKNTNNQTLTRLPVGVYKMTIQTVGASNVQTQTMNNYVVTPYYADANGDLNGDGVVGLSDEVLFNYGKENNKYPTSNSEIASLIQSIQAKLDAAKQANIIEYIKR